MKTTEEMTEKLLRQGREFCFSNHEEHLDAFVSHGITWGGSKEFKIEFNGKTVHMSKTFASMKTKLDKLCQVHLLFAN